MLSPLPLGLALAMPLILIYHLYSTRRKKLKSPPPGYDPLAPQKAKNISTMQEIVEAHADFTAEVFTVCVNGLAKVKTFRRLYPGDTVTMKLVDDDVQLYALGKYVCDMLIPEGSRLPELLRTGVAFEAYLGGRDMAYVYDNTMDFASIIIFYKIPGVPPTQVNLA